MVGAVRFCPAGQLRSAVLWARVEGSQPQPGLALQRGVSAWAWQQSWPPWHAHPRAWTGQGWSWKHLRSCTVLAELVVRTSHRWHISEYRALQYYFSVKTPEFSWVCLFFGNEGDHCLLISWRSAWLLVFSIYLTSQDWRAKDYRHQNLFVWARHF